MDTAKKNTAAVSTKKSFCRMCMSGCGIEVDINDSRVTDVRGDEEHAISQGYICVKGRNSLNQHNGEGRLAGTQKRNADGSFTPIPLATALDEIATSLSSLLKQYGPRAIAVYNGTGTAYSGLAYSTSKAWLKSIGSPNLFSTITIDQSAKWVTMGRMGVFATGKPALQDLDALLMIGSNPIISHTGTPVSPVPASNAKQWLKNSRRQGLKVIVVDPRCSETARAADLHLQIKPGQDSVLLAAIIKLILDNGWEDKQFCQRFLTSVERLHTAVKHFSVEYASQRTGIPGKQIVEAAEIFATSGRSIACGATGPCMAAHSNLTDHLQEALNAICGGYLKAGDPIRATGALFNTIPTVETVIPPNRSWEQEPKCNSADIGLLFGEFPTSRIPDEILHDSNNRIRALICFGSNPATAIADTRKVVNALQSLELLVVIDPRMTETAKLADYVIPTTMPYEREDLTITSDNWFYKNFAQYTPALVPPPADTMDDWEIFWELSHRLKIPLHFKKPVYGMPFDALPAGVDLDLTHKPSTREMLETVCNMSRLTLQELESNPSGVTLPDAGIVQPMETDNGARLNLCPDDVFEEITSLYAELTQHTGEYRYLLASRRVLHVVNSAGQEFSENKFPGAPVFMHPDDIAAENLQVESWVRVTSKYGNAKGYLVEDKNMLPGVIAMPHSWGKADPDDDNCGLTNRLTSLDNDLQTINFMPLQSGIPVNVGQFHLP